MSDGSGQGDFVKWLQATHAAVSNLDANLETMVVCLKNVSQDLNTLIGLMDGRPVNPMSSEKPGNEETDGS